MKSKITFYLSALLLLGINLNAQTWSPISSGVDNPVYFMSPYKTGLIATALGRWNGSIKNWNGTAWSDFENGGGGPTELLISGDTILAGGTFLGSESNKMMRLFNGTTWSTFGNLNMYQNVYWNTNYQYTSILKYKNNLNIICGQDKGLLKFDLLSNKFIKAGNQLSDLKTEYTVNKPHEMNGKLYMVGNYFMSIGNTILVWNDTKWDTLNMTAYASPTGYGNGVEKVASFNNELYISGIFQKGTSYYSLLKYYGSSISEVLTYNSAATSNRIINFFPSANYLFVQYKKDDVYYVGYLNQNNIVQIGAPTVTQNIFSMITYNNEVYVGGDFTSIGGVAANYIAKTGFSTSIESVDFNKLTLSFYPNPFTSTTTVKLNTSNNISANLKLFDALGKEVKTVLFINNEAIIDRGNLANGIYFYSIISDTKIIKTGKIIVE